MRTTSLVDLWLVCHTLIELALQIKHTRISQPQQDVCCIDFIDVLIHPRFAKIKGVQVLQLENFTCVRDDVGAIFLCLLTGIEVLCLGTFPPIKN
jgi:hypothetical protein